MLKIEKDMNLRYAIDPYKLETELGWKPKYNFDTGIQQTIQWYLDYKEVVAKYSFWRVSKLF